MATFDDFVARAKAVARTAGEKTNEMLELARLKLKAAELNGEISKSLEGLGRIYYDAKKSGTDADAVLEAGMAAIDEQQAQLDAVRAKINEHKNGAICPGCGSNMPDDAVYCSRCGGKL